MLLKIFTPKSLKDLQVILSDNKSVLPFGARTSTVIPFSRLEVLAKNCVEALLDLSCMPKEIKLIGDQVSIVGAVSWSELREYLSPLGFDVGCWPTDQSALVLSGLATSATGERCFSRGTLREHCQEITYINSKNEVNTLQNLKISDQRLLKYQNNYNALYKNFKNAPFPKLENEVDLMIGLEGQLGVILSTKLRVFKKENVQNILVPLSELAGVSSIVKSARGLKSFILSLEYFDKKSISFSEDKRLKSSDYLAFEVCEEYVDTFVSSFSENFSQLDFDSALVLDEKKFYELRVKIPRLINEYLSSRNMIKLGTDAQVSLNNLDKLLSIYRDISHCGVEYVLFGHIGDCHLHFNFLPKENEIKKCKELLNSFYLKIKGINGSPFAEHGIGLIKKEYIEQFYTEEVLEIFKYLKTKYDPENKFFPQGYLSYGK